jgi:predicted SAM-dependent methyltransferase
MKLDLGCGNSKNTGFVGVDSLPLPNVDVVHDLNTLPYPFEDNVVDEVILSQVLEHLVNPLNVMEELFRICKNGAKITIGVPYFRSFYAVIDPTHRNFFGVYWFNYFDPRHPFFKKYGYTQATFLIDKIEFDEEFRKMNYDDKVTNFFSRFIRKQFVKFANKHPELYESVFSHLYPLNSLTFTLTVQKI